MRSLFFKIFIWFWVSYMLIGAVSLALFLSTHDQRPPFEGNWPGMQRAAIAFYADQAVGVYERKGKAGLQTYLQQVAQESKINAYLFDATGHEVLQRPVGGPIADMAHTLNESGQRQVSIRRDSPFQARQVVTASGHRYVFVADVHNGPEMGPGDANGGPPERGSPPRDGGGDGRGGMVEWLPPKELQGQKILAFIMVASIVCYGMARYLTAPASKLRIATQQLAAGDLSTRVADKMGRRRDELADLGRDFDQMAERIESVMLAERRLLADISHELRSPLARLQVAVDLASQTADTETQSFLQRIEQEVQRLDTLIGQLLVINRLESQGSAEQTPLNLTRLVQDVAADVNFEARNNKRNLEVVQAEECWVRGSAELLRRAVENVMRNAVHYTAANTTVTIALHVESQTNNGLHQAVLRVRDKGSGVPETALKDIFRPFYRVADARDRQSGGVGLGLSITERAIQLHGGHVVAQNAPDGGLIVLLYLPVMAATEL